MINALYSFEGVLLSQLVYCGLVWQILPCNMCRHTTCIFNYTQSCDCKPLLCMLLITIYEIAIRGAFDCTLTVFVNLLEYLKILSFGSKPAWSCSKLHETLCLRDRLRNVVLDRYISTRLRSSGVSCVNMVFLDRANLLGNCKMTIFLKLYNNVCEFPRIYSVPINKHTSLGTLFLVRNGCINTQHNV